jgi:hypothetical protein
MRSVCHRQRGPVDVRRLAEIPAQLCAEVYFEQFHTYCWKMIIAGVMLV